MEPVTLRTERLELSIPVEADVDAIVAACQDPDIARYTSVPSAYARPDAEEFVAKAGQEWAGTQTRTWAIRSGGALAGMIGLYRIDGAGGGELGYWVAAPVRGRGIVVEASRAVLDWGFAPDGGRLVRIEWHAVVGNVASARAARALGFRYEGVRRSALLSGSGIRSDGWSAALLATDERAPQPWPVLD